MPIQRLCLWQDDQPGVSLTKYYFQSRSVRSQRYLHLSHSCTLAIVISHYLFTRYFVHHRFVWKLSNLDCCWKDSIYVLHHFYFSWAGRRYSYSFEPPSYSSQSWFEHFYLVCLSEHWKLASHFSFLPCLPPMEFHLSSWNIYPMRASLFKHHLAEFANTTV